MKNIIKIRGQKCNLCLFRQDDEAIEKYLKWLSDEEISKWIGHNRDVLTFKKEEEWARNVSDHELVFNIVVNDEMVGNCSIRYRRHGRGASLGILIGEKKARDRGIGTEVIGLLVKFCFEELGVHKVMLNVVEENLRARKCYEKNSFKECGIFHDDIFYEGKFHNIICMEILENEYFNK